jgi:acyl-coenzyme A synthetase/AMP-(fatty) acid ligase
VLCRHPAFHEAAVIGVTDSQCGESVKAIVALRTGRRANEQEIIDFAKNNLLQIRNPNLLNSGMNCLKTHPVR